MILKMIRYNKLEEGKRKTDKASVIDWEIYFTTRPFTTDNSKILIKTENNTYHTDANELLERLNKK